MEVRDNLMSEFVSSNIKTKLIGQLQHFFNSRANLKTSEFVRIEVPIEDLNLLAWLNQNEFNIKTYWCDRKQEHEMAGLGKAHYIKGRTINGYTALFNKINANLIRDSGDLRYFGGISFNPTRYIDEEWHPFGAYYFVIPRFEVIRKGKKLYFVCNHHISKDDRSVQLNKVIDEIDKVSFRGAELSGNTPSPIRRLNIPEREEWDSIIETALSDINRSEFEKIVLARKTIFEFLSPLNVFEILNKLKSVNPESVHFCFQVNNDYAFIGSSPELLYYRDGRKIYSEAIAGTRPRGINEKQDEILENELLTSQKDLREHRFVMNGVRDALAEVCSQLYSSEDVSVLKLARVQHLFTTYWGHLKKHINDADLLSRLHPTPAVGGYPGDTSLKEIEHLEPFQRGWYASPIGWIDRTSAKFTVGIRSGLIKRNLLYLYSGSGIVIGSQARSEWEEIENKIYNFLKVFNINGNATLQQVPNTISDKY